MDVVLPKSGNYVVAVSGGVDSVSLLHVLQSEPGLQVIVAHFDHGMREASAEDRRFVEKLARGYGLPFVYDEGRLGPAASEAAARAARYKFLQEVQRASSAEAIITAHHQDDVLETAIINMLRGSGRRGLTALKSRPGLLRPLVGLPKNTLQAYAQANGLKWREDFSNADQSYLRNYVRHRILPRFSEGDRADLLHILNELVITNQALDTALADALGARMADTIDRLWFAELPHVVAREVLAAWLRARGMRGFDRQTLERLVIAAKTAAAGKRFPVKAGLSMEVCPKVLALVGSER